MYKIRYFDTPFWSKVAEAEEGGACWQVNWKNIMSYINSTTPNRYTLSQHNTIAENVKYWLKTARQREITLAAGLTLCILWWGGQVWGGGGTVWGGWPWQTSDSGIQYTPKPLFCLHTAQQREITPAAGLTLYTVARRKDAPSHLYWGVTSTVTLYITSICVNVVIYHQKLYHFAKKIDKILHQSGAVTICPLGGR